MVKRLFITPQTMPTENVTRCLVIPASREWLGIFNAALLTAANQYNYEQLLDTDLTPEECAAKVMQIYETYLSEECEMCACSCPTTIYRWTADGTLEQSIDGGVTWTPAPNSDPRNTATKFPPLPGADGATKRCVGADNIVENFNNQILQYIDQLAATSDVLEIALAVASGIAVFLGIFAPFTAAVAAAAAYLVSVGADAVAAAFDTPVWDRLRCNLYCNMQNDATFTTGNIAAIKMQIDEDETGVANILLKQMIDTLGTAGLTNVARTGVGAGSDCGSCGCDCLTVQSYPAFGAQWSGGTETDDGSCGHGLRVSPGDGNGTFTIPDRDGRLVTAFEPYWCDASGSGSITVTCGGVASDESPVAWGGTVHHTWSTPQDSDTVVISCSDGLGIFMNHVNVFYEC